MRWRKLVALLGSLIVLGGCIILYLMMDLTIFPHDFKENKWIHFEDHLKQFEDDLQKHHESSEKMQHSLKYQMLNPSSSTGSAGIVQHLTYKVIRNPVNHNATCSAMFHAVPNASVQLLDMYDKLKFDNLDGGAWKQGWNVEYNANQWNEHRKLKVFVVPHSHNDPGWIKTFEDYYRSHTRSILNNMVKKLGEDPRRKFIWAEISFFSLWWDEIKADLKEQVKKLVGNGQLEIVTGGWVMTDEANSHYFSMLQEMIEGHNWLMNQLDYKPSNSWSIDPFGHTPSMAFLLKRMGLENLVIQRVHYSVKKHLARNRNLEFRWRQMWDGTGATDLFTHMMPFYSYDVPHTCGPDPKICCQFDFRRLPGFGIACPWKVPPQIITENNVAHRAQMLLDQYRKKAQLYATNVVLAPLGDDFRYDHASEWDAQFNNYQKLFDYMNNNPNLHVEAQFGTLRDYFNAVRAEKTPEKFPALSGDFFTYADRDDHYWSGYYTSRPFYKRMDRILINYLRSAEILFGLAWGSKKESSDWLLAPESGLLKLLSDARQSLSLFQHHDGITGTAKDYVVEDYAKKMIDAISGLQHVIQQVAHYLLSPSQISYQPDPEFVFFDLDDGRKYYYSLPEKTTISVGEGLEYRKVVLYNSLAWQKQELVTIRVSTPFVKVTTSDGSAIQSQTSPVFLPSGSMSDSHYDVSFVAEIPALSLITYMIHALLPNEHPRTSALSHVRLLNYVGDLPGVEGFEKLEKSKDPKEFSIHNSHLAAAFSEQGLLKAITLKKSGLTVPVHLDFVRYQARPTKETSGAYLFLPPGEADILKIGSPVVRVLEGPLFSQVDVALPSVIHTVRLYNISGADSLGLEIYNLVDISEQINFELAMRFSSNIKNGDEFFTDLNGLQMIKRKHFSKLPLQANYYPLPSMAYIEDKGVRLSVVSGQPCGVGALKEGQLEVMQDRRLNQDDNRGLGQGVTDNHPMPAIFRLILEERQSNCVSIAENHPAALPSLIAHISALALLNPILRLLVMDNPSDNLEFSFTPVAKELSYDIHLVKLHTFSTPENVKAGVILFRQKTDSCFAPPAGLHYPLSNGLVNISSLFPSQFGDIITEASLSFLHTGKSLPKETPRPLCPMEMAAFLLPR
ncbi:alpha-mannosidase 2 [Anabrus simplex]|uniref:alpha-mannosidase 2 n=1 Tax=Anabrus simplex TaxID=316456 RepID=UPI0035A3064B